MAALRCPTCDMNWPVDNDLYAKCPRCERTTSWVRSFEPMDAQFAHTLKKYLDFERYYEKRSAVSPSG